MQLSSFFTELPNVIQIKDELERPLRQAPDGTLLAGPVNEGGDLKLACWAVGGKKKLDYLKESPQGL